MNNTPLLPEFTATERAVLEPFVTSVDARIFGLRNLPEVVKELFFRAIHGAKNQFAGFCLTSSFTRQNQDSISSFRRRTPRPPIR